MADRSPFDAPPAPSGLVLHLLGGLAETSLAFDDHTVALLGFDEVAFERPAVASTSLAGRFEVLETTPSIRRDGGVVTWSWEARVQDSHLVCRARAGLLVDDRTDL